MSAGIEYNAWVLNQQGSPALFSATLANRPAAGFTGRIFISTDTREIYRDTGVIWELIGSGGGSVNIYNSDGTLTGNRIVTMGANTLTFTDQPVNTTKAIYSGHSANPSFAVWSGVGTFGTNTSKVITGYLTSATQSATIAANTGNFTAWSPLSINSAGLTIRSNGEIYTAQFTTTGRFLLGTTVDAGYLADINGTSAFSDWLYIRTNQRGIRPIGDGVTIYFYGARGNTISYVLDYQGNEGTANSNRILFQIGGSTQLTHSSGTSNISILRLAPSINSSGGTNNYYGFRYQPNILNAAGISEHFCFESTAGKMVVTNVTTPSNTVQTTTAAFNHRYNIPAGASYTIGLPFGSITPVNYMVFAGSATIGAANIWAANSSFNQFAFDAPGSTVTVNQITLRSISALSAQHQFYGTESGTITHLSGLQVTGFYNANTGVITPVINNGYGVLINNLDDYGHTFTLVNRWGIYQDGTSDNNYLAGKLVVGTNTVTARQVHIAGDIEYTTTLAATSGGSSGQHLNIWVNGTQYKIKLENP